MHRHLFLVEIIPEIVVNMTPEASALTGRTVAFLP